MKRILVVMSMIMITLFTFGQSTIYYQPIDKKISIGIGKTPKETKLVLLTNTQELELIVNDKVIQTECHELDKKNFEHIVTIPNFTLDIIKNNLRHGSVFVNGKEYSALDFGAAISAAEWYASYYNDRRQEMPRMRMFKHKPFMMKH